MLLFSLGTGLLLLVAWLTYLSFGFVVYLLSGRDPTVFDHVGKLGRGFPFGRKKNE